MHFSNNELQLYNNIKEPEILLTILATGYFMFVLTHCFQYILVSSPWSKNEKQMKVKEEKNS